MGVELTLFITEFDDFKELINSNQIGPGEIKFVNTVHDSIDYEIKEHLKS